MSFIITTPEEKEICISQQLKLKLVKKLSGIKVAYYGINFQKALKQLSLWLSLNIKLEIILFLII